MMAGMPEIEETLLPGVGVRHEFTTAGGERVAVVTHRDGRREIARSERDDPDAVRTVLRLTREDSHVMADLLGGNQVSETVLTVQQQIEGLAIEWITLAAPPSVGRTIGEGAFRTRTGASIVAVLRNDASIPAPGPEFAFESDDVIVAVGTADGLAQLRALLSA
jgi:TrkA domain protein